MKNATPYFSISSLLVLGRIPQRVGEKRTLPTGDSSYYQSSTCATLV